MLLSGPEAEDILFYWNFLFYMFLRMWSDLPGYSWDLKIFLHVALSELYRRENKRLLCWRVTTAMITKGPLRCVSHLKEIYLPYTCLVLVLITGRTYESQIGHL